MRNQIHIIWGYLFVFVIFFLLVFPSAVVQAANAISEPLKCSGLKSITKTTYRDATTTKHQTFTVTSVKITSLSITKTVSAPSLKSVTVNHYHTITKSIIVPTTIREISTSTYTAKYTSTTITTGTRYKDVPTLKTVTLESLKTIDYTKIVEDQMTVTKSVTVTTTVAKVSVVTHVVSSTVTSPVIKVSPTTRMVTTTTTAVVNTVTVTDSVTLSASTVTATIVPSCQPVCAQLVANPSFESQPDVWATEFLPGMQYAVIPGVQVPGGAHSGGYAAVFESFGTIFVPGIGEFGQYKNKAAGIFQKFSLTQDCDGGLFTFQAFVKTLSNSCYFNVSDGDGGSPFGSTLISPGAQWIQITATVRLVGDVTLELEAICDNDDPVWLDDITLTMQNRPFFPEF
ncbi:hypothetical protein V1520DRAFT_366088 [Lipomyces starkeyi]|uniref:Flo11 domain-containing protein n=1 Tax=Lipomyces starkeyi NRRL Y-11557 TaxID=675824 RepID=A0A1E3Q8H5_LIPST|nr:hypothetical protein LIPSTDRAFT_27400 [Lipomyces starkeyi NRRL Y-11557]